MQGLMIFILMGMLWGGHSQAQSYPEVFEQVAKKEQQKGFKSLTKKEQQIYAIWWLEGEVNNGGFNQYFWNSAGNHAGLALQTLQQMGATKTADLLSQAIEAAFGDVLPPSRSERQDALLKDEEAKSKKLDELDQVFYLYQEDISQLMNEYLKQ